MSIAVHACLQAATPFPGTTTAWTSFKKSSVLPVQVDEAMTTRPVLRSTAITDQVANAEFCRTNKNGRRWSNFRMTPLSTLAELNGAIRNNTIGDPLSKSGSNRVGPGVGRRRLRGLRLIFPSDIFQR